MEGFNGELKNSIYPNSPVERGKGVDIHGYVDINHPGEKNKEVSLRVFIFLNTALIQWFSSKQTTIDTSVLGAELVAMKIVIKTLQGIRNNLRMMGVPISGSSYIYGDNMSVINNNQRPESTLKRKRDSICYHDVREYVVISVSLTVHVVTNENCADLDTKVLYDGKRRFHVSNLL